MSLDKMKIKMKTTINNELKNTLLQLPKGEMRIGWFAGQKEPNGIQVFENAYMQENGFWIKHKNGKKTYVPPRPFMRITATKNEKIWEQVSYKLGQKFIKKKITFKQFMEQFCLFVKGNILETIASRIRPNPNLPASKIPLIDSGTMTDSLTYKVRQRKR